MRFKCNCYNYKTDFIIPAFNHETGKINPFVTFSDGSKVFYNTSDEENKTTISFNVKKHNRSKFTEAIEEQLMYFDNVNFNVVDNEDEGSVKKVYFKAEIIYNSKNLIVSNSYYLNKPHIVLVKNPDATTGINYGNIDFRELEMEQIHGSIAFKCPARQVVVDENGVETVLQEGVDVTPSREKVIWNEATKNYIKGVILAASQEASEIIEKELQETDFLKWISACRSIIAGKSSTNRILNKLATIVDTEDLKPRFGPDPRIKYGPMKNLLEGFNILSPYVDNSSNEKVKRETLSVWGSFDAEHFYAREEKWSKFKDLYIMNNPEDKQNPHKVCTFSFKDLDAVFDHKINMWTGDAQAKVMKEKKRVLKKREVVLALIEKSEWYKDYDTIEVPVEFSESVTEEEEIAEEKSKFSHLSAVDRRDIEKRMVAYTLRYDDRKEDRFTMDKIEPKTIDVMNSVYRTYYATKEDEPKLKAAAMLLKTMMPKHSEVYPGNSNVNSWDKENSYPVYWFDNPPVRYMSWNSSGEYEKWADPKQGWDVPQLVRVSQDKVKFITQNPNVKHIDELFLKANDKNEYTMDVTLVKYYTASKLERIQEFTFMKGLGFILPELQKKYCELQELRVNNYSTFNNSTVRNNLPAITDHMDKLYEFQKFCATCDDAQMIMDKSKNLFVLSDISSARAVDLDMLADYDNIVEFAEEVEPLLSQIEKLKSRNGDVSDKLEKELIIYLKAKSRDVWDS